MQGRRYGQRTTSRKSPGSAIGVNEEGFAHDIDAHLASRETASTGLVGHHGSRPHIPIRRPLPRPIATIAGHGVNESGENLRAAGDTEFVHGFKLYRSLKHVNT